MYKKGKKKKCYKKKQIPKMPKGKTKERKRKKKT